MKHDSHEDKTCPIKSIQYKINACPLLARASLGSVSRPRSEHWQEEKNGVLRETSPDNCLLINICGFLMQTKAYLFWKE